MMFAIGVENSLYCSLALIIGAGLALLLGGIRSYRIGVSPKQIALLTVMLPICAQIGSNLGSALVNAGTVNWATALFVSENGPMIWGGILGAIAAVAVFAGKNKGLLEAYAPAIALGIGAARIAEGLMGQGYGEYWYEDVTAFCRFPFMVYDAYDELWAWALFVLEAIVAVALCIMLLKHRKAPSGDGLLLLCGLYGAAQIVLESLRRDEFLRWGFVRVEEVCSAIAVLMVLVLFCKRAQKGRIRQKALCFLLYAAMIVLCLLLEFATEGRIPFLLFLEVEQCYMAMAGACVALAGCVLWMRHISLISATKELE